MSLLDTREIEQQIFDLGWWQVIAPPYHVAQMQKKIDKLQAILDSRRKEREMIYG